MKNAKRLYYRKCGLCGARHEQSDMVRTNLSPNGWLCKPCYYATYKSSHVDYHESMNYITAHDDDIW